MSSVTRPTKRLPRSVYRRRRLLVLVVLVALVWALVKVVGSFGGEDPPSTPGAADATPTATPSATPTVRRADRTRTSRDVTVDVGWPSVSGACPPDSVSVAPDVADGTRAESDIRVVLRVSSTADAPCTVRVDGDSLVLAVADTDSTLWNSQLCGGISARTVDVQPGWSTVVGTGWDGRVAGEDCVEGGRYADPGAYTVKAALMGGEPAQSEFTLVPAPKPTPKPTPGQTTQPKPTTKPREAQQTPGTPGGGSTATPRSQRTGEPQAG